MLSLLAVVRFLSDLVHDKTDKENWWKAKRLAAASVSSLISGACESEGNFSLKCFPVFPLFRLLNSVRQCRIGRRRSCINLDANRESLVHYYSIEQSYGSLTSLCF